MKSLSPICLFVYTRLVETHRTLEALKQNNLAKESKLYIFSDGAKNEQDKPQVEAVREALRQVTGFHSVEIIASETNKGLAGSVISGVSIILKEHDRVIVVEDDLIASPNFINFMNQALEAYENENKVQSISGYSLKIDQPESEVYFQQRPGSWGWATWKDRWDEEMFDKVAIRKKIEAEPEVLKRFARQCGQDMPRMLRDSLDNLNDSWYVRWAFDHFQKNTYSLYPIHSFIENIGFEPDATHCRGINVFVSVKTDPDRQQFVFPPFAVPERKMQKHFLNYFTRPYKLLFRIKLLRTAEGCSMIWDEIKSRSSRKPLGRTAKSFF